MDLWGDLIGAVFLLVGTVFCVLGVYGLLCLPDLYNRLHAGGKVATFGAGGVLLSLLFLAPSQAGIKGMATAIFLLLTAPLVTHILARAAHRLHVPLADVSERDDLAEDRRVGSR